MTVQYMTDKFFKNLDCNLLQKQSKPRYSKYLKENVNYLNDLKTY